MAKFTIKGEDCRRINLCPICRSPAVIREFEQGDGGHGGGRWPAFSVGCSNEQCAITTPTYPRKHPKGPKTVALNDVLNHWNGLWDQKKDVDDEN